MKTHIVFIHKGCPNYLYYAIAQAKRLNPQALIHLIGDETNRVCGILAKHHYTENYWKKAAEFQRYYEHHSDNKYHYELFCYQRWFVLQEFMLFNNIDRCVYLDSDLLLYCNLENEFKKFDGFDIALYIGGNPDYIGGNPDYVKASGHVSFWLNIKALNKFCSYLMNLYINKPDDFHQMVNQYHSRKIRKKSAVDDMSALGFFAKTGKCKIEGISKIIHSSIYPVTARDRRFEQDGELIRIFTKDNQLYARLVESKECVKINVLHFQGFAKKYIKNFFIKDSLRYQTGFFKKLEVQIWVALSCLFFMKVPQKLSGVRAKFIKKYLFTKNIRFSELFKIIIK